MSSINFNDGISVNSSLTVKPGTSVRGLKTSSLDQESLKPFVVDLTTFRVWDAIGTTLPSAAANDDLGLISGTLGTSAPTIETGDLKAAGATTRYARVQIAMPKEYDSAADVVLRIHAKMQTTVADTSATVDVEAYKYDEDGGVGSDLISTSATSINSETGADYDFTVNAATLEPGSILDVRVALAINDGATGTAVIGRIGAVTLMCDTRG